MLYNVLIQVEAILELTEAFDWYEEQKDGLGFELIEEIENCYQQLAVDPQRYPYINQLYRRIKTNRFPFILVYEIEGNDIIVISIRHIKRKPL